MVSLRDMSVCLVGLGQIGGSLAKAFRGAGVGREVVGVDVDEETAQKALETRTVDRVFKNPGDAVSGRDLVILAAPVGEITKMIRPLGSLMDERSILMDVGSTKRTVLTEMASVENRVDCVGGHPMCGTEASGFAGWSETLFRGAPFVLVPSPACGFETIAVVGRVVESIGAKPFIVSAESHDRIMATISHLPYVLAVTLMRLCETLGADAGTAFELAAGGFLGSTRLAESDPLMAADFCKTNADNLDSAMRTLVEKADEIITLSRKQESSALLELLKRARVQRVRLRETREPGREGRGN